MPLDPNIILANADPARQFDPVSSMQKASNLQLAMMQQQAQKQQMQDAADFRNQYGISPGMAAAQQKVALGNLETVKAQKEAAKAHLEAADALADQQDAVYQWGKKALAQNPEKAPEIHAEVLRRTQENAKTLFPQLDTSKSDDPRAFTTTPVPYAPDNPDAPKVWDTNSQAKWLDDKINSIPMTKKKLETMKLALDQQKADAENWQLTPVQGGFALMNKKTGEMKAAEGGFKPLPNNAQVQLLNGQSGNSGNGVDVTKPLANSQAEGLARDFADGKPQPNITSRTPKYVSDAVARGRQIYADANGGSETGYGTVSGVLKKNRESWVGNGQNAQTIKSLDTAAGHIARLGELVDALGNGNVQMINSASNSIKTALGLSAAPTRWDTVASMAVPEVLKVAKGAGAINQSEEVHLQKLADNAKSPELQKAFIEELMHIMGSRVEAMDPQYQSAYPGQRIGKMLRPQTVQMFRKIGLDLGGADKPAKTYKPGDTETALDGTKMIFNGGDPMDRNNWKKVN